jgi:hypothetical protein
MRVPVLSAIFRDLHITQYVSDIQSEHNYISNKWYLQYQLRVLTNIPANIRLYSTFN